MALRRLPHYLKSCRKRAGLSQVEMARLLGCACGAKVSRYERFARRPTLEAVFAYETALGIPAAELCAGIFAQVREATARRARTLMTKLEARHPSPANARKLELLSNIAAKVEDVSRAA